MTSPFTLKYLINCFYIQVVDLQNELKISKEKNQEIINDYEVLQNYIVRKQQMNEGGQLLSEKNVSIIKHMA